MDKSRTILLVVNTPTSIKNSESANSARAPKPVDHPTAGDGAWMALQAIMACFDSTNGLSMAWDESTEQWGELVTAQAKQMNIDLGNDYNQLYSDANPKSGSPDPSKIQADQTKYNNDQTTWQNNMQQSQSELDKQSQAVKDLGTSTQSLMTNTAALLQISSNLAQMLGRG